MPEESSIDKHARLLREREPYELLSRTLSYLRSKTQGSTALHIAIEECLAKRDQQLPDEAKRLTFHAGALKAGAIPCGGCGSVKADELDNDFMAGAMIATPRLRPWSVRVSDYESVHVMHNQLEEQVMDFREKSGLVSGGDPGGVTPEMLGKQIDMYDDIARAARGYVDGFKDYVAGAQDGEVERRFAALQIALMPYREQHEE